MDNDLINFDDYLNELEIDVYGTNNNVMNNERYLHIMDILNDNQNNIDRARKDTKGPTPQPTTKKSSTE